MKPDSRAAIAELLGTFIFCFVGAGSICMNQWSGGSVGLLGIALAHGTALAVMISALGHLSGGHFNPAVTFGLLAINKIDSRRASAYIVAQLIGAAAAGFLLRLVVPPEAWHPVHLGTPTLGIGISPAQAMVMEVVLTFALMLTVCGTAIDPKGSWQSVAGFGIGAVLVFSILVAGPITGAALNPARVFGPALASGTWDHHLIYWLGPLSGAVIAAFLYGRIFLGLRGR